MPPRSLLLVALPMLLSPLAGCAPEPAPRVSLDDAFSAAAAENDVPRDLLVAIAYSQTRFDDGAEGSDEHKGMRGLGIMDIGAGSPTVGPDATAAAGRAGVTLEEAAHDRRVNIALAASELRREADRLTEEQGVRFDRIDDWVEVVGWYSGSADGGAQRSYARQVYRWIEGGLKAQDPVEGRWLVIRGRELDIPALELVQVGISSADSALASNVVAAASCNYAAGSRTDTTIDTIVVHTAQGSYSGTYNWFQNCGAAASAHYVVRSSDGEVTQMVAERDTAWHAGDSGTNARSVSIELEGYIEDPSRWYTSAAYRSLAALVDDVATRQGVTLDRTRVIGHMEVPGCGRAGGGGRNCHTDPGTGFGWDDLMGRLGAEATETAETTETTETTEATPAAATGDLAGFVREGSIYDANGAVGGATVVASSGQRDVTDGSGYFFLEDLPAGSVSLRVTADGYATVTSAADIDADITNWNSVAVTLDGGDTASPPASSTAVPSPMSPIGGATVVGPEVDLRWSDTGADAYEVHIYWYDGADWNDYYTYTTSSTTKRFWPSVDDADYAWAVRASYDAGRSEWSALGYFAFGS